MEQSNEFSVHAVAWSMAEVRRFWEFEVTQTQNSFSRKYGKRILGVVKRHIPRPGPVVDLAGGPGIFTSYLLDAGYSVLVVEDSGSGRKLCDGRNQRSRGYLGAVPFDSIPTEPEFDGVIGVELLEHLGDQEIRSLFLALRKMIVDRGIGIFTTPNAEPLADKAVCCPECGAMFHRWQHVRSVDVRWMQQTLNSPGFSAASVFMTDWSRSIPDALRGRGTGFGWRTSRRPHLVGITRRTKSAG